MHIFYIFLLLKDTALQPDPSAHAFNRPISRRRIYQLSDSNNTVTPAAAVLKRAASPVKNRSHRTQQPLIVEGEQWLVPAIPGDPAFIRCRLTILLP